MLDTDCSSSDLPDCGHITMLSEREIRKHIQTIERRLEQRTAEGTVTPEAVLTIQSYLRGVRYSLGEKEGENGEQGNNH